MIRHLFDSRHIKSFHAVVTAGTHSAATTALGHTQPAVTQQMKALERSAGSPLFVRIGRRMRLTEAGEALARHAEAILGSLSVAEEQVTAITRLRAGRVRVCGFPSANATLVPETLAQLAADHPGIAVPRSTTNPRTPWSAWRAASATSPSPSPTPDSPNPSRTT